MEFWGVEVKAGQPLKVNPEVGRVIHISQAALGEGKKEKGNHSIPLRLKINNQNFVVGSLSAENFPQVTFDLVFEKEFELSHDWKNGSVYFCGYSADNPYAEDEDEDEDEFGDSEDSEDERIPLGITNNGKVEPKGEEAKPVASKGKSAKPESSAYPKGNVMVPKKDQSDEDEDDDADESDDDKDMMDASDDIGDSEDEDDSADEDDSEDEDEEPKKAGPSNKRPTSASKTPIAAKKAKLETPQKTDGKKGGGHTATPYPSKKQPDGKTPANSNKAKEQTPKSVGKVTCNSCSKAFNSDSALQSHTKAKHAGK